MKTTFIIFLFFLILTKIPAQKLNYPWKNNLLPNHSCIINIPPPNEFNRVEIDTNGFGDWLRHLPLLPSYSKVSLYNGDFKTNQSAHYRVIDIDIGNKDLQQCADAIIRIRAEYLYSQKIYSDIHFNFTSGDTAAYTKWIKGYRPKVENNKVVWTKNSSPSNDYRTFKSYLEILFIYAGSYSLCKEMKHIGNYNEIQIGDVFIQGGFPGHAVIVVDKAESIGKNQTAILLAQSYMPAQDIHILVNENNNKINPWYIVGKGYKLFTPEWTFNWSDLYRFE